MSVEMIERQFHEKVSAKIRLAPEGIERYRVFTPFLFDDGDHLAIVLSRRDEHWVLTDEAHTYMHLTYDIDEKDLQRGTRQKIIANTLSTFRSLAIFDGPGVGQPEGFARFSDICEKQFSSLAPNRERITRFLQESLGE